MMFVSSSSIVVVAAAGFVVHVVDLCVEENEVVVGKNKDFLVDFVAKRLKKSSHLMKD